jgi:hypothetical protein
MFHELLNNSKTNPREPGPLQSDARRQFPLIVKSSHLEQRLPGSPIPSNGKYVIIGVATYSRDELRLLDEIEAAYSQWANTAKVLVFDVMECKDMEDMRSYAPPHVVVAQTPVVALWDGGEAIASQTGLRMTREMLKDAGFLN